jgi:hypothetical protein
VSFFIFDDFFLTQTLDLVLGWIFGFDYDLFIVHLTALNVLSTV